jgi:hypothetical protein
VLHVQCLEPELAQFAELAAEAIEPIRTTPAIDSRLVHEAVNRRPELCSCDNLLSVVLLFKEVNATRIAKA